MEWTGTEWLVPEDKTVNRTTDQLKKLGYLGVRREQTEPVDDISEKCAEAELHADASNWRHAKDNGIAVTFYGNVIGKAIYWEDDVSPI